MKKFSLFLIASILSLSLMACGNQPAEEETTTPPADQKQEEAAEATEPTNEADAASERIVVMDAAMYRGTITAMETTDKGTVVTLEQAEGTDFGAVSKKFLLDDNTQTHFEKEELIENAYLEVYYGTGDKEETAHAIGANIYDAAEMVNFNGTFQEVIKNKEKPEKGQLLVTDLKTGEDILFNYDTTQGTQFYVNLDDLKAGDKLNIFHKGMFTMSLPAQGIAQEVRFYAESPAAPAADSNAAPQQDTQQTPAAQ